MQAQISESQIGQDYERLGAVLAGHETLEISHEGGELRDIWNHLYEGMSQLELPLSETLNMP